LKDSKHLNTFKGKTVNIRAQAPIYLIHAIDLYLKQLFQPVHAIQEASGTSTLKPYMMREAFKTCHAIGELKLKKEATLKPIAKIFDSLIVLEDLKKRQTSVEKSEPRSEEQKVKKEQLKETYTKKKNAILEEITKELLRGQKADDEEHHSNAFLIAGKGLSGTYERFGLGRTSRSIRLIVETIVRALVREATTNAFNYIVEQGRVSINEAVIIYVLKENGFRCFG